MMRPALARPVRTHPQVGPGDPGHGRGTRGSAGERRNSGPVRRAERHGGTRGRNLRSRFRLSKSPDLDTFQIADVSSLSIQDHASDGRIDLRLFHDRPTYESTIGRGQGEPRSAPLVGYKWHVEGVVS